MSLLPILPGNAVIPMGIIVSWARQRRRNTVSARPMGIRECFNVVVTPTAWSANNGH